MNGGGGTVLNATTKNLEFDTVRSEEDESINIHHAVPAKTADYETGLSHFGVDKGTDVSLSLQYLGKRETMGIDISQGGSKEAQMMGFSQIHDSGPHSHQNQRKTLFSDSVYSDPSQISIGRSPGFQTWGSQSKSKVIANPYESEYYEDALEGTDQSIESLMKRVDKNPIALLNELCTKVRLSIDYLFSVENTPRRMVFYCQVTINGRRFTNKAFEGESKQEARTVAALETVKYLEQNPEYRSQMLNLLHRLERKFVYGEEPVRNPQKPPSLRFTSIANLLEDEANILSVLNTYAQNTKDSLKWRFVTRGDGLCVAEIQIGNLRAHAVRNCKKSAKLTAAKSFLKQIDANSFWKSRFLATMQNANIAPNYPPDPYATNRGYAGQFTGPIKRQFPGAAFQQTSQPMRGLASSFVIPEPINSSSIHFGASRDSGAYGLAHSAATDLRQGQAEVQGTDIKLTPQDPDNTDYNDLSHLGSIKRRRMDSLSDNEDVKLPQMPGDIQDLKLVVPVSEGFDSFGADALAAPQIKSLHSPVNKPIASSVPHNEPESTLGAVPDQHSSTHWPTSQFGAAATASNEIILYGAEGLEAYEQQLEELLNSAAAEAKHAQGADLAASYGFRTLSRVFGTLLPQQPLKLVPLGSFLLECMHKHKLEVDCMILDAADRTQEVDLISVKAAIHKQKASSSNSELQLFQVSIETTSEGEHTLVCQHQENNLKYRFFSGPNDPSHSEQGEQNEQPANSGLELGMNITRKIAALQHAFWLEQNLPAEKSIQDVLRLVRCWRFNTKAPIASELLDLAVSVSSGNFEETGTAKILMKFFGMLQLVLHKHHANFYRFSGHHSFLIQQMTAESRDDVVRKAHATFRKLMQRDVSCFQ